MHTYKEEIGSTLQPLVALEPARIVELLETPPDPGMGDLAFPCYVLAPRLKQSPVAIAAGLARDLSGKRGQFWEKAEARGPYLNFYLDRLPSAGKF